MGTVKVTNIEPIADNGTLTIGNSGDTIALTSGAKTSGFGKIGQVVSGTLTTSTTISASAATDIGLSATITPTSTSSKILCMWKIMYGNSSGNNGVLNLLRGTTKIAQGTETDGHQSTSSICVANSNNYWNFDTSGNFLDSPATTSATTYKFQTESNDGAGPFQINRTARNGSADAQGISVITLMEILD